jgi:hypothetical protein
MVSLTKHCHSGCVALQKNTVIRAVSQCRKCVIARKLNFSGWLTKQSFPSRHVSAIDKIASSPNKKNLGLLAMTVFISQ